MGVAGVLLGLLGGWIIGAQQGGERVSAPIPVQATGAPQAQGQGQPQAPPPLDQSRVSQLEAAANDAPRDAAVRAQLGNLYFDSERFEDAARWYEASLAIDPRNVDVSTDLGIVYYYTNQPDRALAQFDKSLAIDPSHSKTLLNVGVVRAWGKQDLDGAAEAWERVVQVAPNSEEARRARQGLEGIRAAHPEAGRGGGASRPQD